MATPAYLGIPDDDVTKEVVGKFLQEASATDFWHDFHKASSKTVLDRLGKSYDIGSGLSVRAYQSQVLALRQTFIGTNLYEMFKAINTKILLVNENTPKDTRAGNEDAILDKVLAAGGITYGDIRSALIQAGINNNFSLHSFTDEAPITLGIAPNLRPYTITAAPAKVKGTYEPIAQVFEAVSGGSTNFILMIDASFISMKRLFLLASDPKKQYNFFIIESVENEGDPATKIGSFLSPADGAPDNVNVYFLRDGNFKTLYKSFTERGQTSNLFSGCSISASRSETGLIDASIQSGTVNTTVKNIGTASEPKEAGFLAFQKLITMGLGSTEEAMAHFLLKRAGDWCQALCLLDRGRPYQIIPVEGAPVPKNDAGNPITSITLDELIQLLGDVQLGLLTHDKILKAYALFLGLNVFSSMKLVAAGGAEEEAAAGDEDNSSTSATWLVYYKNILDANAEAVLNAANTKWQSMENEIDEIYRITASPIDTVDETIRTEYNATAARCTQMIQDARDSNEFDRMLIVTRLVLDAASRFNEFPEKTIKDIVTEITTLQANILDAQVYFATVSRYEPIIDSYTQTIQSFEYLHNLKNLLDIPEVPSSFQDELTQIQAFTNTIKENLPLRQTNKVPTKPLEYFLYNTAPAIKEGIRHFQSLFDIDIMPLLQYDLEQLKMTDPKYQTRVGSNRLTEWYKEYKEALGIQAGGQRGGNTEFDIHILIPLLTNRINTRDSTINEDYNKEKFIKEINKTLNRYYGKEEVPFKKYVRNLLWKEYIVEEEEKYFSEPYLSEYLSDLVEDFLVDLTNTDRGNGNKITDSNLKALNDGDLEARSAFMNQLFQQVKTEAREVYTGQSEENLIDVGRPVTNNNGLSYTALDKVIVDDEQEYLWKEFFSRIAGIYTQTQEGGIEITDLSPINSLIPTAHITVYYRFLLSRLDQFLNTINRIELTINDEESGLYQEPYFTEDTELTVRKIDTCVSNIKNLLLENTDMYEALIRIQRGEIPLNDDDAMPSKVYVSYDTIVNEIAIVKILVIILYYKSLAQKMAEVYAETATADEAAGAAWAGAARARATIKAAKAADPTSSLNKYQWVRLFYLICPSIQSFEELKNELPEDFHTYIDIAKIFHYINSEEQLPELDAEQIAVLDEYATVFGDGLFITYIDLRGGAGGGKHKRNRYRKTRSKRKPKRRMTKGRKGNKQKQKRKAITRRR